MHEVLQHNQVNNDDLEQSGSQQSNIISMYNQYSDSIQIEIDESEEILKEIGQL